MKRQGSMERILGKIIITFLLMLSIKAQAYITLEVTSFDGRMIKQVSAGEPFIVKVSTDEVDRVHDIQINGLQGVAAQKTGLSLITINGKKTAQVTYQVYVEKPGSYTFGPATMPDSTSQSESVVLKINAERVTHAADVKKEADAGKSNVLLRLSVDTNTAVVGQKITTVLRAYFPEGEDISIDQIISNDPATIATTEKVGPKKGEENIAGKNYVSLEWEWEMYPKQAGELVVPAYFVDYAKALPVQQGFGSLAMFFGPRYERKRAYSNALSIQVRPLPESPRPVSAVGSFVSYRAHIKPSVAKKYEGMVLTLTVEGEGNMIHINEPELTGLSDAFKYYFSKSFITPGSFGQQKSFEYIVQGMQEGEWEIPPQVFSFYDVESRSYKTLESGALLVTVLPGQAAAAVPSAPSERRVQEADANISIPLMKTTTDVVQPTEGALPFDWFLFLLSVPLAVFAIVKFAQSAWLAQKISPHYIKRRAFVYAHKDLARAYRRHDVRSIYAVYTTLIQRRTGVEEDRPIDKMVEASAWPDTKKKAWRIFHEKIAQAAYAASSDTKDVVRLFHEAEQWLKDLEGII